MTQRAARMGLCLVAGAGGYAAVVGMRDAGVTRADEVLASVRSAAVTAEVSASRPLVPFHGTPVIDARRRADVTYWSQPTYFGPVDEETVGILLKADRAEALEPHLTPRARDELLAHLVEANRDIKEAAILARDEVERTKKALRETLGATFVIRGADQEADPLWKRRERELARLDYGKKGTVMDEALQLRQQDYAGVKAHIYYVIDYAKWPAVQEMQLELNRAVRRRILLVRGWIAGRCRRAGSSILMIR